MTEVRFYHLQKQTMDEALPLILQKAYASKKNIVVRFSDEEEVERINNYLWSFKQRSFLPHGSKANGNAEHQPIWLTADNDNPNNAKILVLTAGQSEENMDQFDLCCDMLDGRSDEQVSQARERWKTYKEKGFEVTYWVQDDSGKWEQKS
ncbi:MAG: DNA polymerase III subunit chi [Pseudomonadota bacterium]